MSTGRTILSSDRINLERVNFLVVDDNQQVLDIIAHSLTGFGVRNITKCTSARAARDELRKNTVDFLITDAQMPEESGYELLEWIRTEAGEPNRFVPAVMVTGHTRQSHVMKGRDSGAHFVVAKPITPKVLLERIFWVAREERNFVECDAYSGPDRRFKREGPPAGTEGRRKDDAKGELGEATERNLSQDEINSLLKPAKVAM